MSDEKKILDALKRGRRLTTMDAINDFGCTRLAARVYDLRAKGHPILDVQITHQNTTTGKRSRFKEYFYGR